MLNSIIPYRFSPAVEAFHCQIFRILERTATVIAGVAYRPVYSIECADWVHIVPVTEQGSCLLVEQYRFGADKLTLEIPGGLVDDKQDDLLATARRELEEETGYTATNVMHLATLSPNSALQSNSITYFLATGAYPLAEPRAHDDPFENITVHSVPVTETYNLIATGAITNALSVLGLLLAKPHLNRLLSSQPTE